MTKLSYTLIDTKTLEEFTFESKDLVELFDYVLYKSLYIKQDISNKESAGTFKLRIKGEDPKIAYGTLKEYDELAEILIKRCK